MKASSSSASLPHGGYWKKVTPHEQQLRPKEVGPRSKDQRLESNGPRFGHLDQLMAERGMIVKQMAASPTSNLLKAEVQSLREISSPPAAACGPSA